MSSEIIFSVSLIGFIVVIRSIQIYLNARNQGGITTGEYKEIRAFIIITFFICFLYVFYHLLDSGFKGKDLAKGMFLFFTVFCIIIVEQIRKYFKRRIIKDPTDKYNKLSK
jgi:hypothetical protein